MRRVVSLFLPRWPTDRLRRKNPDLSGRDRPLVTVAAQGQRRVLASVDETAERLGLSRGMTVTHAQSLSWIGELFDALLGSVLLIVKSLTWQWFAGIASVFAIMYSVCVAGGMALYRVATLGRLRRN